MSEPTDIRVLIADDEPGVNMILRKIIARVEGFQTVGEAADGEELMRLFAQQKPQVVFLDVDMPKLSGVECANRIQDVDPACVLIFATAHEEYRGDAFEVYAFDYLIKPFKVERAIETLTRVRITLHRRDFSAAAARIPTGGNVSGRMMLKHHDGVSFIDKKDILLVQREERSTVIYTEGGGRFVTGDTLAETEEKLGGDLFFRSHKSYIINLDHIRDITPYGRWTYIVRLNGTEHDALITYDKFEELEKRFA